MRHSIKNQNQNDENYVSIIFHVANAYSNLLNAIHDDMLWRQANRLVIELFKSKESIIKIGGLKILDESYKIVGSELSSILGETIPSLTELIEDPDNAVEIETRNTIKSIENSIGESIDNYFQ